MISGPVRRLSLLAVIVALVFAGAESAGRAQAPAGPGEISVDFLALTSDGRPITDLKASEVTLRVGGRPRVVKSLKLVQAEEGGDAAAKSAAPASAVAPPFATNSGGGAGGGAARSFLFFVDTASLRPGGEKVLRDSMDRLVGALTPRDRVMIMNGPRNTFRVDFTSNREAIRAGLAQIAAQGSTGSAICRSREVLDVLKGVISSLSPADGPTNVVLFSASLTQEGKDTSCEIGTSDYQRVPIVLSNARARMFVVQADETVTNRSEGLEQLAGVSNAGAVIRLTAGDNPFARIARETAVSYVVTFEPEVAERSGQNARLEVRVAREGITVRASNEVTLAKADAAAPGAAATNPKQMMLTPAPFTSLPLRATAFVMGGPAGSVTALVMMEATEPGTKLNAATVAFIDGSGKIAVQVSADEKQVALPTIALPVPVANGTYRLRVAATDATGRAGAVDQQIEANLTTLGPLKLSGMIVGAVGASGCQPKMQFNGDETVCVLMEMFGAPTAKMGAVLDVVSTPDGKPLATAQIQGGATNVPDKFTLSVASLSLAGIPAGDYILRATIGMEGAGDVKLMRTLRKLK